jgi:hypothetical protein
MHTTGVQDKVTRFGIESPLITTCEALVIDLPGEGKALVDLGGIEALDPVVRVQSPAEECAAEEKTENDTITAYATLPCHHDTTSLRLS